METTPNITALPPTIMQTWLTSKPANAYVGMAGDCEFCPIAQMLFEVYGLVSIVGTTSIVAVPIGERHMRNHWQVTDPAPWMLPFIELLDETAAQDEVHCITAGYALEVFGRVMALEGMVA